METIQFSTTINAPKEKVWDVLWTDATYRKWTAVFYEGSYARSNWEEGGEIEFLSPENDGMFSVIKSKVPNREMVFEHKGEIKKGVRESRDWSGATESYFLHDANGGTRLDVEVAITDEMGDYFNNTFPKALQAIKELSEQ